MRRWLAAVGRRLATLFWVALGGVVGLTIAGGLGELLEDPQLGLLATLGIGLVGYLFVPRKTKKPKPGKGRHAK